MKKKIYLKMALGITLLVMIGTNICNSFKKETLSDLVLFDDCFCTVTPCRMLKRWQIGVRMAIRLGQLLGQLHVIISKVRGILPA